MKTLKLHSRTMFKATCCFDDIRNWWSSPLSIDSHFTMDRMTHLRTLTPCLVSLSTASSKSSKSRDASQWKFPSAINIFAWYEAFCLAHGRDTSSHEFNHAAWACQSVWCFDKVNVMICGALLAHLPTREQATASLEAHIFRSCKFQVEP